MQDLPKIRTPLRQQWRRIRYQLMPVLCMGLCIMLAGYLWRKHASRIDSWGEVGVVQRIAYAQRDGMLVPLPTPCRPVQLYDEVKAGQVLAQLDDRPLKASLAVLKVELTRLQLELEAQEQVFKAEDQARQEDYQTEARRLAVQVESLRLGMLDRQAQLNADKLEQKNYQILLDALVAAGPAASEMERRECQLKHDVVAERILGVQKAIEENKQQLEAAQERAKAHQPLTVDLSKRLAPLRAAITREETALAELNLNLEQLDVYAPQDGRIVAIHRWPGQSIRIGEPIVTIAAGEAPYIASYVRQDQRIVPTAGMSVEVRTRLPLVRSAKSHVLTVGPQLEPVPHHQLRDPRVAEWGVPILIAMPPSLSLRPGDLVDLRFEDSD